MIRGSDNSARSTSIAKPRRRTGGGYLFLPLMALGTGLSFITGFQFQKRAASNLPATILAQAGGGQVGYAGSRTASGTGGSTAGEHPDDTASSLETFQTVYNLVREHYVDSLPGDRPMSYGAIRAMLKQLNDPNCYFLDPGQCALLDDESHGHYAGIGATLYVRSISRGDYSDSKIVVVSTLPGSPAARAGVHAGDIITHIDGKWVLGADPYLRYNRLVQKAEAQGNESGDDTAIRREEDIARQRVQGGIGLVTAQVSLRGDTALLKRQGLATDKIVLTVERPGIPAALTFTVSPGVTEVVAPAVRSLAGGAGYIRISAFTDHTISQLRAAMNSGKLFGGGLILDLRGNGGGASGGFPVALSAAEDIYSTLTTGGSFGTEATGEGKKTIPRSTAPATGARPGRIIVLVDRGTAAGAEALTAALAGSGAATIEGSRTFGDPYAQSLIRLPDGSGLTLTTGKLSGPNHADWAANGITPQVPIGPGASEEVVLARALRALPRAGRIALKHRD